MRGRENLLPRILQPVDQSPDAVRLKADLDFIDQRNVLAAMQLHLHGGSDELFGPAAFVAHRDIVLV